MKSAKKCPLLSVSSEITLCIPWSLFHCDFLFVVQADSVLFGWMLVSDVQKIHEAGELVVLSAFFATSTWHHDRGLLQAHFVVGRDNESSCNDCSMFFAYWLNITLPLTLWFHCDKCWNNIHVRNSPSNKRTQESTLGTLLVYPILNLLTTGCSKNQEYHLSVPRI